MSSTQFEDVMLISSPHRRGNKRQIPDTDKDRHYWERRYRNNISARKSRENRRQIECNIRVRISNLEEENALLKKELEVLKQKLDLPVHVSILTEAERNECVKQVWIENKHDWGRMPSGTNTSSSDSHVRIRDFEKSGADSTSDSFASTESETTQFCYVLSSHSPSQIASDYQTKARTSTEVLPQCVESCFSEHPRDIVEQSEYYSKILANSGNQTHNMEPADLSTKKRPRTEDHGAGTPPCDKESLISRELARQPTRDSLIPVLDLTGDDDIRSKLELLSEQVAKMQKTFNV